MNKKKTGINVIGYINSQSGLGEAVRRNIAAIENANINTSKIDILSLKETEIKKFPYSLNLIQISLNDIPEFLNNVDHELFRNRYTILFFVWESEYIPSESKLNIDLFDEVWTPSEYCKSIIKDFYRKPITIVPHPIDVNLRSIKNHNSQAFCSPEKFSFLFIFNYYSSIVRKNPLDLIEAFKKAFESQNNQVELIIKTSSGENFDDDQKKILQSIGDTPNIKLYDIKLDQNNLNHLINQCDCYISLHHSEGFGLTLAEAMYMGKPTIATNYSGNTQFMKSDNSYLVDYEKGLIKNTDSNFSKKTIWAYPDIEDCVNKLKFVFENKSDRLKKAENAKSYVKDNLSYDAVGSIIKNRVTEIIEEVTLLTTKRSPSLAQIIKLQQANHIIEQQRRELKNLKKNLIIRFIFSLKKKIRKLKKNK